MQLGPRLDMDELRKEGRLLHARQKMIWVDEEITAGTEAIWHQLMMREVLRPNILLSLCPPSPKVRWHHRLLRKIPWIRKRKQSSPR